jgi:hypothetical protein
MTPGGSAPLVFATATPLPPILAFRIPRQPSTTTFFSAMQPFIFCCRLAICNVEAFAKLTNHRHHLVQIRGCFYRSVSTYWVESLSKNKLTSDNALPEHINLIKKNYQELKNKEEVERRTPLRIVRGSQ